MNDIPIMLKFTAALMAGIDGLPGKIMHEALDSISMKLKDLIDEYDEVDLPVVAAAMKMHSEGLMNVMGPEARKICEDIIERSTTIAIVKTGSEE